MQLNPVIIDPCHSILRYVIEKNTVLAEAINSTHRRKEVLFMSTLI